MKEHVIVEDAEPGLDHGATALVDGERGRDSRGELVLVHETIVVVAQPDVEPNAVARAPLILNESRNLKISAFDRGISYVVDALKSTSVLREDVDR